jgi:hypothetical protein
VLVLLTLAGWEATWRQRGFEPTAAADDAPLWAQQRARLSTGSPETVAITGSSIIQAAVDLDLYARETGGRKPVQLGLFGSSPLPVLEDLAADPSFVGLAIAEMAPLGLFDGTDTSHDLPNQMLEHYRAAQVGPARRVETRLRGFVQGRTVFRRTELAPAEILRSLARGSFESLGSMRMTSDRQLLFDFSVYPGKAPPAMGRAAKGRAPMDSGADLDAVVSRMAAAVGAIQKRGGEVVLVSFDCRGPHREIIGRLYPLARYWPPLEKGTTARKLDLSQHPELRDIECPDAVHLGIESQKAFTRVLAREVEAILAR